MVALRKCIAWFYLHCGLSSAVTLITHVFGTHEDLEDVSRMLRNSLRFRRTRMGNRCVSVGPDCPWTANLTCCSRHCFSSDIYHLCNCLKEKEYRYVCTMVGNNLKVSCFKATFFLAQVCVRASMRCRDFWQTNLTSTFNSGVHKIITTIHWRRCSL